jgi:hypothetical protein
MLPRLDIQTTEPDDFEFVKLLALRMDRFAQVEGRVRGMLGRVDGVLARLDNVGRRLCALEEPLAAIDAREEPIAALDARVRAIEEPLAALDARVRAIEEPLAALDARVRTLEANRAVNARFVTVEAHNALVARLVALDARLCALEKNDLDTNMRVGALEASGDGKQAVERDEHGVRLALGVNDVDQVLRRALGATNSNNHWRPGASEAAVAAATTRRSSEDALIGSEADDALNPLIELFLASNGR